MSKILSVSLFFPLRFSSEFLVIYRISLPSCFHKQWSPPTPLPPFPVSSNWSLSILCLKQGRVILNPAPILTAINDQFSLVNGGWHHYSARHWSCSLFIGPGSLLGTGDVRGTKTWRLLFRAQYLTHYNVELWIVFSSILACNCSSIIAHSASEMHFASILFIFVVTSMD